MRRLIIMFRRVEAIVTIITAIKGSNGHYGSFETGVGCHFWAVTTIGPNAASGHPEKRTTFYGFYADARTASSKGSVR